MSVKKRDIVLLTALLAIIAGVAYWQFFLIPTFESTDAHRARREKAESQLVLDQAEVQRLFGLIPDLREEVTEYAELRIIPYSDPLTAIYRARSVVDDFLRRGDAAQMTATEAAVSVKDLHGAETVVSDLRVISVEVVLPLFPGEVEYMVRRFEELPNAVRVLDYSYRYEPAEYKDALTGEKIDPAQDTITIPAELLPPGTLPEGYENAVLFLPPLEPAEKPEIPETSAAVLKGGRARTSDRVSFAPVEVTFVVEFLCENKLPDADTQFPYTLTVSG